MDGSEERNARGSGVSRAQVETNSSRSISGLRRRYETVSYHHLANKEGREREREYEIETKDVGHHSKQDEKQGVKKWSLKKHLASSMGKQIGLVFWEDEESGVLESGWDAKSQIGN